MCSIHPVTQQFTPHTSIGSCPPCPTCTHACKYKTHSQRINQCYQVHILLSYLSFLPAFLWRLAGVGIFLYLPPRFASAVMGDDTSAVGGKVRRVNKKKKKRLRLATPAGLAPTKTRAQKEAVVVVGVAGIRGSGELLYPAQGPQCRLPGHQTPSEQRMRD